MKKATIPCSDCTKMTEHILKGEGGVYEAMCRKCKTRKGVAMDGSLDTLVVDEM